MSFFDRLMGEAPTGATYAIDLPERDGIVRFRLTFYGRVQGVGFRYTVQMVAQQTGVTGWVHNNVDGSVVAELQGKVPAIRLLVYQIQEGRFIRIEDIRVEEITPDVRETQFTIR